MRRMIALVLVCVMLCMLCGCSAQGQDYKEAMKYYNAQDYAQALTLEYSGMDSGGALTYNSSKDTLYNDSMVMIRVEQ